jgi:hypothetical protein
VNEISDIISGTTWVRVQDFSIFNLSDGVGLVIYGIYYDTKSGVLYNLEARWYLLDDLCGIKLSIFGSKELLFDHCLDNYNILGLVAMVSHDLKCIINDRRSSVYRSSWPESLWVLIDATYECVINDAVFSQLCRSLFDARVGESSQ